MTTAITAIIDVPHDSAAFEAGYPELLRLAKKIPDIQRMQTSRVWPKEDGTPAPAHRLISLYFADYDAASRAVTTAEAGEFIPELFALATGGVRIVFADVEEG
ncbi:hypothetical protein [Pseudonocardia lacus]|uniref:hypothetical protein n=1 Tax=Pseudonocardia lacus TaxID=2835865 RepID=UPI001BDCB91E|nr:hypothetical protein [Pseudonocardia lacus]